MKRARALKTFDWMNSGNKTRIKQGDEFPCSEEDLQILAEFGQAEEVVWPKPTEPAAQAKKEKKNA